jgi:UDP-3-O-[3-hydroxymyristoyl] glucosamine N-acyltransferase
MLRSALFAVALFPTVAWAQDADADGVPDASDNCPGMANPGQQNGNADAAGDACAHPTATVASGVTWGAGAYVGGRANVGTGVSLGANVEIARRASIGAGANLGAGTKVGSRALIGAGVALGAGSVVGAEVEIAPSTSFGARALLGYGASVGPGTAGEDVVIGNLSDLSYGLPFTIGDRVSIGRGSILYAPVLASDVQLGADVIMTDAVEVGAGTVIRSGGRIHDHTVIGENVRLGRDTWLGWQVEIGDETVLRSGVHIASRGVVPPGELLPRGAFRGDSGGSPATAGISCDTLYDDFVVPSNDYWVYPNRDVTGTPVLVPCAFTQESTSYFAQGAAEEFVIPPGVKYVTVKAWGAGGGGGWLGVGYGFGYRGGAGGFASAVLDVTGLTTLQIVVGDGGANGFLQACSFTPAAFGGGGQGAPVCSASGARGSGGGGGLAGVFAGSVAHANALVIAGGGGGSGRNERGGDAGGSSGEAAPACGGSTWGGGGGTQNAGGTALSAPVYLANGPAVRAGAALYGGSGAKQSSGDGGGGGGGGGYYGGGGGGTLAVGNGGCGGGGGSGYVDLTRALAGTSVNLGATSATSAGAVDDHWDGTAGNAGGPAEAGAPGMVEILY